MCHSSAKINWTIREYRSEGFLELLFMDLSIGASAIQMFAPKLESKIHELSNTSLQRHKYLQLMKNKVRR